MKFSLTIETDNDAFVPDPAPELAKLLHGVAERIALGNHTGSIRDVNGNAVGRFELVP